MVSAPAIAGTPRTRAHHNRKLSKYKYTTGVV
jgi:hypothetical protein